MVGAPGTMDMLGGFMFVAFSQQLLGETLTRYSCSYIGGYGSDEMSVFSQIRLNRTMRQGWSGKLWVTSNSVWRHMGKTHWLRESSPSCVVFAVTISL